MCLPLLLLLEKDKIFDVVQNTTLEHMQAEAISLATLADL